MGPDDPIFAAQRGRSRAAMPAVGVQAYSTIDLARDVNFPDFLRGGVNAAGATVTRRSVMRNASVRRSINLIANAIGMLPFGMYQGVGDDDRRQAKEHPLNRLLASRPNGRHTAFEFRRLMQRWLLIDGNAYAMIVRDRTGQPVSLLPLHPAWVRVKERDDWTLEYRVRRSAQGGERMVAPGDILHLRADSDDGVTGASLLDEAAEVLGLAISAEHAAGRLFKNGTMAGSALETDKGLGPEAIANLRASLEEFTGADNAHRTLILEEGLKYKAIASTAKDAQNLEARQHSAEEIGRVFGVPRPFLMLDDTSWGSGIEQLGLFLVQYTLAPWFVCWEQGIARALLSETDRRQEYYPKFNERALLRGSVADQGEFLAKLMGSGGSPQIATQNEARRWLELPRHEDGDGLSKGNGGQADATPGKN